MRLVASPSSEEAKQWWEDTLAAFSKDYKDTYWQIWDRLPLYRTRRQTIACRCSVLPERDSRMVRNSSAPRNCDRLTPSHTDWPYYSNRLLHPMQIQTDYKTQAVWIICLLKRESLELNLWETHWHSLEIRAFLYNLRFSSIYRIISFVLLQLNTSNYLPRTQVR